MHLCISTYTSASHRIAGGVASVVQEEQTGTDPQEVQAQEVPEEEEPGEDLPECVDHQPSSFERGKPRSILSLLLYKSNSFYIYENIYCCIKL